MIEQYRRRFPSLDRMEVAAAISCADRRVEDAIVEQLRNAHDRKVERLKAAAALLRSRRGNVT